MDKVFYLIRGVPGSGKSTTARALVGVRNVHEVDDFYTFFGYHWFCKELHSLAVCYCMATAAIAMICRTEKIAVSNCFVKKQDMAKYIKLANLFKYKTVVITKKNVFGNIHNVPEEKVQLMLNRFEW